MFSYFRVKLDTHILFLVSAIQLAREGGCEIQIGMFSLASSYGKALREKELNKRAFKKI